MLEGGNCYWDVEHCGPAKWCAWSHDLGGTPLAEVHGHDTRHEAVAALQVASTAAWEARDNRREAA